MNTKLVSLCLYGTKKMYLQGAIENARLMSRIYPSWSMRVYCENTTDTKELEALGVEIHRMGQSLGHSGMMWRFLPAWEQDIERVIFRDADSRLNVREAAAVRDWIDSGFAAHAMLDHPNHAPYALLGGMWGILGGVLPGWLLPRFIEAYGSHVRRGQDMAVLSREVFPLIRGSLITHASVAPLAPLDWPAKPFPSHPPHEGFVGQQYDDQMQPMWVGLTPAVRTGGEPCQK